MLDDLMFDAKMFDDALVSCLLFFVVSCVTICHYVYPITTAPFE